MISVPCTTGDISYGYDICFADDIRFAYVGTDIISYLQGNYHAALAVYHIALAIYHSITIDDLVVKTGFSKGVRISKFHSRLWAVSERFFSISLLHSTSKFLRTACACAPFDDMV